MSWENCIKEYNITKITIDEQRAKSLRKIAINRKQFIQTIPNIDTNLMFIFESYYTLLVELLHSLAYGKGYIINNHVCLGHFLVEFYNLNDEQRLFQKLRKQRNNIVYYGEELSKDVILKNTNEIQKLINSIENLF